MSGKHTKGPWSVHMDGLAVFGAPPGRQQVVDASVCSPNLCAAEQRANARVIASAPDGVALARAVLEYFGGPPVADLDRQLYIMAKALIEKARGA